MTTFTHIFLRVSQVEISLSLCSTVAWQPELIWTFKALEKDQTCSVSFLSVQTGHSQWHSHVPYLLSHYRLSLLSVFVSDLASRHRLSVFALTRSHCAMEADISAKVILSLMSVVSRKRSLSFCQQKKMKCKVAERQLWCNLTERLRGLQEEEGEENDHEWNPRSDNNGAHVLLNFPSPRSL